MSICTGRKEMMKQWMGSLRDGGRWIVVTADTVYQCVAFKVCVYLPAASISLHLQLCLTSACETDTLRAAYCALLLW